MGVAPSTSPGGSAGRGSAGMSVRLRGVAAGGLGLAVGGLGVAVGGRGVVGVVVGLAVVDGVGPALGAGPHEEPVPGAVQAPAGVGLEPVVASTQGHALPPIS